MLANKGMFFHQFVVLFLEFNAMLFHTFRLDYHTILPNRVLHIATCDYLISSLAFHTLMYPLYFTLLCHA